MCGRKVDTTDRVRICPSYSYRKISIERCERDRGFRMGCRPYCKHYNLGYVNLDKFPALEERIGRLLTCRYIQDKDNPADVRQALADIGWRRGVTERLSPRGFPYWYHLWLERDANSKTTVDRWKDAGFQGIENDGEAKAFLREAAETMQITLIEIESKERTGVFTFQNLLNKTHNIRTIYLPESRFQLPRYQPYLCRIYMAPWAWRIAATPFMKWPDFGMRDPKEVFLNILEHLGWKNVRNPTAFHFTTWLAYNYERFESAVKATVTERKRLAKIGHPCKPSSIDFRLNSHCDPDLDAFTKHSLELMDIQPVLLPANFHKCWEVHEPSADAQSGEVVAMDGLRSGLLFAGKNCIRFETVHHERFQNLRDRIAKALGPDVTVISEYEDPAVRELMTHLNCPTSDIPPGLLSGYADPPSLLIPKQPPKPKRNGPWLVRRAAMEWLEEPQELLQGLCPADAVRSSGFPFELLDAARYWIRKIDEECLLRGTNRDDRVFMYTLGLRRSFLTRGPDRFSNWTKRLMWLERARLLPLRLDAVRGEMLGRDAVISRLSAVLQWTTRCTYYDFIQAIFPIFRFLWNFDLRKRLSQEGQRIFQYHVGIAWYLLAGKRYRTTIEFRPTLVLANVERYTEAFFRFYELQRSIPWDVDSVEWLGRCSQPYLAQAMVGLLGEEFYEKGLIPSDGQVDDICELIGWIIALIDEFDNALRDPTDVHPNQH